MVSVRGCPGQPCGALRSRSSAAAPGSLDVALEVYRSAIDAIRRNHAIHELPIEDVVDVFALGFTLEQLRQDVHEAADRISERSTAGASGWNPFKS